MSTRIRCYKTLNTKKCSYRNNLSKMLMTDNPIFSIKLETTGLDPSVDQVIKIGVIKAHFEDYELIKDDVFERLIKVNREIPEHCFKLLNISQSDINSADNAETVMKELLTFMGSDTINVVGFFTKDFIEPFLDILGFYSGHMLKIENIVDTYQMAVSLLEPDSNIQNYKFRTICEALDINTQNATDAAFELFNLLYKEIPIGQNKVGVRQSKFWSKGSKQYIVLDTECGSLGLNCRTGYFKEKTPGIFDIIDMDYLTQYICEKQNCINIEEFIKNYLSYVKH